MVVCRLPAKLAIKQGTVSVAFAPNGQNPVAPDLTLTIFVHPQVLQMTPLRGTVQGGTTVRIDFDAVIDSFPAIQCRLATATSPASVVGPSSVECRVPPSTSSPGLIVEVFVTLNSQDFVFTRSFQYVDIPYITSVSPPVGTELGGSTVSIALPLATTLWQSSLHLKFGNSEPVVAALNAFGIATCVVPAHAPGPVTLLVSVNGVDYLPANHTFTYLMAQTSTGLVPALGPVTGGTVVSIFGTNFASCVDMVCRFGPHLVAPAVFVSAQQLQCTTPSTVAPSDHLVVSVWCGLLNRIMTLNQSFSFYTPPQLVSLAPRLAPTTGGTKLSITTSQPVSVIRPSSVSCRFDSVVSTSAVVIDATTLSCVVPPLPLRDQVVVEVSFNGQNFHRLPYPLRLYPSIQVKSVEPSTIFWNTSTTVLVSGRGMLNTPALSCRLGANAITAGRYVSSTKVACPVQSTGSASTLFLAVSNNGVDFAEPTLALYFHPQPTLTGINPAYGPVTGRTLVEIQGLNFVTFGMTVQCAFGNSTVAAAVSRSSTSVLCLSPAVPAPQSVLVGLQFGTTMTTASLRFEYIPTASVASLSPVKVPVGVPTRVDLVGVHLQGPLQCEFFASDSTTAVHAVVVSAVISSSTSIHCTATLFTPGVYSVHVGVMGQPSARSDKGGLLITVHPTPVVQRVSPLVSVELGGGNVVVTGFNFSAFDAMSCLFGVQPVVATFQSSTQLKCVVPASLVRRPLTLSISINHVILYKTPFSIIPTMILDAVDTQLLLSVGNPVQVILTGRHFVPNVTCVVMTSTNNLEEETLALFYSSESIGCIVQAQVPGQRFLTLKLYDAIATTSPTVALEFVAVPAMVAISPHSSDIRGGSSIAVTGRGFHDGPSLSCHFGLVQSRAVFLTPTRIVCLTPRVSFPSQVLLTVSNVGGNVSSSPVAFSFESPVVALSIHPSFGSVLGGVIVRVLVAETALDDRSSSVRCWFGNVSSIATRVQSNVFQCVAPSIVRPAKVPFHLRSEQQSVVHPPIYFTYVDPVQVVNVTPASGPVEGATAVRVLLVAPVLMPASDLSIQCAFGNQSVPGFLVSPTVIQCVTPPSVSQQSNVSVAVTVNGQEFSLSSESATTFEYQTSLQVDSVVPTLGSPGTSIRVMGTNLKSPSICHFGDARPSTPARFVSSNEVVCELPTMVSFTTTTTVAVDAVLTLEYATGVYSNSKLFKVFPPLSLTSLSPSRVFESGGARIMLQGRGFLDVPQLGCLFGRSAVIVPALWVSKYLVECVVPPLEPGNVSVAVTQNGIDRYIVPMSLSVSPALTISSISPIHALVSYPTTITVLGTGFEPSVRCRFGDVIVVPTEYTNRNTVTCTAPPSQTSVPFQVTNNGLDFAGDRLWVSHDVQVDISDVFPSSGPVNTTTTRVWIRGTFTNMDQLHCQIGDMTTLARIANTTHVECPVPPVTTSQVVPITLLALGMSIPSTWTFSYYAPPAVESMEPSTLFRPSTAVTVRGRNFLPGAVCRFGAVITGASVYHSSKVIECPSPQVHARGYVVVEVSNNGVDFTSQGLTVRFESQLSVVAISPPYAIHTGGSSLMVIGTGFPAFLYCRFGTTYQVGTVLNTTHCMCTTPPLPPNQVVVLELSTGDEGTTNQVTFWSMLPPNPIRVDPSHGSTVGNTLLTVHGTAFSIDSMECCFNRTTCVPAAVLSDTLLTCVTPPFNTTTNGPILLTLRAPDSQVASLRSVEYFVHIPLTLARFVPTRVPEQGHTVVTVSGAHFSPTLNLFCVFGTEFVAATFVNFDTIECVSPPHAPGSVSLGVSANGKDIVSFEAVLEYHQSGSVTAITPTTGSVDGNSVVVAVVSSNNLLSSAVFCKFGSIEVRAAAINTSAVSCLSPRARTCGAVSFSLVQRTKNSVSVEFVSAMPYIYEHPPTLVSIFPNTGSTAAPTIVTLTGSGFHAHTTFIRFGNIVAACMEATNTSTCTVQLPRHAIETTQGDGGGVVTVDATNNNQDFSTPLLFLYTPRVAVVAVAPSVTHGSTLVTVAGVHFVDTIPNALRCRIGGHVVVPATFVSATSVQCLVPTLSGGNYNVEVSVNGQDFTNDSVQILVNDPVEIYTVQPPFGSTQGRTVVTVTTNSVLDTSVDLFCAFGDGLVSTLTVLNASTASCVAPPTAAVGTVPLSVVQSSVELTTVMPPTSFTSISSITHSYTYIRPVEATSLFPSFGFQQGGTVVSMAGDGFVNTAQASCVFGNTSVPAVVLSSDLLRCVAPPFHHSPDEVVEVMVTMNGVDITHTNLWFRYVRDVALSSITPSKSTLAGGSLVDIRGAGFDHLSNLTCVFGANRHVSATVISRQSLSCVVPPVSAEGTVVVRVAMNMHDVSVDGLRFDYQIPALLYSIAPTVGPHIGHTKVLVTGEGFTPGLQCAFGAMLVNSTFLTSRTLSCVAPPLSIEVDVVEFSLQDPHVVSSQTTSLPYYVVVLPDIVSVQPSS
ncbi:hypothetical protein DYB36_004569, partial [Aphanomyces astaci]